MKKVDNKKQKVIISILVAVALVIVLLLGYLIFTKPEADKDKGLQKLVEKIEKTSTETSSTKTSSTEAPTSEYKQEFDEKGGTTESTEATENTQTEEPTVEVEEKPETGIKLYDNLVSESQLVEEPAQVEAMAKEMNQEQSNRDTTILALTQGNLMYYLKNNQIKLNGFKVTNATFNTETYVMTIDVENTMNVSLEEGKKELLNDKNNVLQPYFEYSQMILLPGYNFNQNVEVYWVNSPEGRILVG